MKKKEPKHTAENLVRPFTTQYHLNTHSLDLPTEQVHGRTSSNGGDIVSLQMINDLFNSVQTFLDGKSVFVMNRS